MVVFNYINNMETIGSRIKHARSAAGLSQDAIAKSFNINRVSVSNWETDVSRPDVAKMPELAGMLNVSIEWLMAGEGSGPQEFAPKLRMKGQPIKITPGNQLLGSGRMPVYAAAQGGDGHIIVSFDQVDTVKRPSELEDVRGGYGLLITGESMIPAFWPGDMALVNPTLTPSRLKNAVFYHTPPNGGDAEAMIKQLNSWTDKEWILQQYNPLTEFREFRQEWPICHRVVGKYDAR